MRGPASIRRDESEKHEGSMRYEGAYSKAEVMEVRHVQKVCLGLKVRDLGKLETTSYSTGGTPS